MYRRWLIVCWIACLALSVFAVTAPAADKETEDGFRSLFTGKDLTGWDGNLKFWSVKDGAITGQTTTQNPTKGNTFLVWQGGDVSDFELRLKFRIVGGNSGIQFRSREVDKWVIGGYQADFDAAGNWAGTLYEEKGRGVLARRGNKVVISAEGKKETLGKTASEEDILASIKKEGWNDYTIIARGNHIVQKINGLVTVDITDNQESKRSMSGLLALQLHAGPPMMVQFKDIRLKTFSDETSMMPVENAWMTADERSKKIVLVAGPKSHGYMAHEHYAGCVLLAEALNRSGLGIQANVYRDGWPKDPKVFDDADAIVMFCDGGGRHMVIPHIDEVDEMAKQGVGITCLHYGVEVSAGKPGDAFLDWIGGYFEAHWSVNPHWTAEVKQLPEHPVARGVKPFAVNDEWYYHMRFRKDMKGVTPIVSAVAPASTLSRPDGAHSGNPAVREEVAKGTAQHLAWVAERDGGGRGFGFTGAHWHWLWANDSFRTVVLNGIAWTAHVEIPAGGIPSKTPTIEQLQANQDYPERSFDAEKIQKIIDQWSK